MKISFNFDTQSRSFHMTPEDNLEVVLMDHLTELCTKGASLRIRKVVHEDQGVPESFLVEMRINGKDPAEVRKGTSYSEFNDEART